MPPILACYRHLDRSQTAGGETHVRRFSSGCSPQSTITRLSSPHTGSATRQFAKGDSHEYFFFL